MTSTIKLFVIGIVCLLVILGSQRYTRARIKRIDDDQIKRQFANLREEGRRYAALSETEILAAGQIVEFVRKSILSGRAHFDASQIDAFRMLTLELEGLLAKNLSDLLILGFYNTKLLKRPSLTPRMMLERSQEIFYVQSQAVDSQAFGSAAKLLVTSAKLLGAKDAAQASAVMKSLARQAHNFGYLLGFNTEGLPEE